MAPSAHAQSPWTKRVPVSTLSAVAVVLLYGQREVGAEPRAEAAEGALVGVLDPRGSHASLRDLFGFLEHLVGAELDAVTASLAKLFIQLDPLFGQVDATFVNMLVLRVFIYPFSFVQ